MGVQSSVSSERRVEPVPSKEDARARRLALTRARSAELAAPLSPEDQVVQAMPDASPTKWHLAHTTWFWETLVLTPHLPGYRIFDPRFAYCFNSYYESLGPRYPRPNRGLLTRPSADEVKVYRAHVDAGLARLVASEITAEVAHLIDLGIAHEEQHQELALMDILALFATNPLNPVYRDDCLDTTEPEPAAPAPTYSSFDGGIVEIGHRGPGFAFDNEGPRHKALLGSFRIADRLVTCGEWLEFMRDGGYCKPTLWLSDGWSRARQEAWEAPLYWRLDDADGWMEMTLAGLVKVAPTAAVSHVSYYEADAFARWAGKRLPTEFEWEMAADAQSQHDHDSGALRPLTASRGGRAPRQLFGEVWQWTQSAYSPYPGYKPGPGALGEYNGKFMANQFVLRGGSCVTPGGHSRTTYRNFFYPHQRWQFSGLRLAEDA